MDRAPHTYQQPCGPGGGGENSDPEESRAYGTHRLRGGGACGTNGFAHRAPSEEPTNCTGDRGSAWLHQWDEPTELGSGPKGRVGKGGGGA